MSELTEKQKAKRYDYIADALLKFLDKRIEDRKQEFEEENYPCTAVVDDWLNDVDNNDDVIPFDIYLLLEQMVTEWFPNHLSRFESVWNTEEDIKEKIKARNEFYRLIGGTHGIEC
jgi:hypothetical protein